MPNEDCLFCKIVSGEMPMSKVYEDDDVLAFLDIHPVNPGHTLIVSKKHSMNMLDTDDDVLKAMIVATKRVSQGILKVLDLQDFNLELNNGRIAGQIIPHLHWHIVPRTADDGLKHWPGLSYEEGEADNLAGQIRDELRNIL